MKKKLKFETQEIKILKKDMRVALDYLNGEYCLLGTAMRRLGFKSVQCSGWTVKTSLGIFSFDDGNKIHRAYDETHRNIRKDATPFTIILIPA